MYNFSVVMVIEKSHILKFFKNLFSLENTAFLYNIPTLF